MYLLSILKIGHSFRHQKMVTLLQKTVRVAFEATNQRHERGIKEHLLKIGHYMKKTKASDVHIHPTLERILDPEVIDNPDLAPVIYVPICEHEKFTFSMFILRSGTKIPLHDHPGMYGVLKIIHGKVMIQSYTGQKESEDKQIIEAEKHDDSFVCEHEDVCYVTPSKGNFHEITAINGPAAFLDILFPPYNQKDRCCNYYDVVSKSGNNVVTLKRVPSPPHFWTEQTARYAGPSLL